MAYTEIEKKNIKAKLMENCEKSWAKYGYKKTNLEELCMHSGISKGGFYLFFDSKESLFCEVMIAVHKRFVQMIEDNLKAKLDKYQFAEVLKKVYREYIKIPFLIETTTPDFIAFMNRLSPEKLERLKEHNSYDLRDIIRQSDLIYQIDEELGISALGFVFKPLPKEQRVLSNQYETIDFMIDVLVEKIFV